VKRKMTTRNMVRTEDYGRNAVHISVIALSRQRREIH
jgi:hypothetical protein